MSTSRDIELAEVSSTPEQTTATVRHPWRDDGYPSLAKWMASSEDFFILRRFGSLNARVLLLMQDRIVELERDLHDIDEEARRAPDEMADSSTLRDDPQEQRLATLDKLIPILREYSKPQFMKLVHQVDFWLMLMSLVDEFLVAHSHVQEWPIARKYHVENVKNWFFNNPGAIAEQEREFINQTGDLVALGCSPPTPLRNLARQFPWLIKLLPVRATPRTQHVQSPSTNYHNVNKVEKALFIVVVALGLLLLLGPMWALQFVSDNVKRLGIITGFILVFTALLSAASVAKPFEVLAAIAA